MKQLIQPILSETPEADHNIKDVLTISEFLNLLKEEEDYFDGEQNNTKLMITRLRKIFYDQWGWNSELIRGASEIEGRYEVEIVEDPKVRSISATHTKKVRRYKENQYQPKYRRITYRPDDRVYGNSRVGQVPFIYKNDHQEVLLPDGFYCDVAHVLTGLDAFNHPQVVSPLPGFLSFLDKIFPKVDSNMDIVTWLGDIASSAGDFLFACIRKNRKPLSIDIEQNYVNIDAPGSDMLGDIDPYVIRKHFDVSAKRGKRVTEILEEYYCNETKSAEYRKLSFITFCDEIGLKDWNGSSFANEETWLKYYEKQLRNNTSFQVFSLTEENLKSVYLPIQIWFNSYRDVVKLKLLLQIFLKTLKELVKRYSNIDI
ncbi:MAG: hypothetical protein WKG06_31045 [Segetibacter sp.]